MLTYFFEKPCKVRISVQDMAQMNKEVASFETTLHKIMGAKTQVLEGQLQGQGAIVLCAKAMQEVV